MKYRFFLLVAVLTVLSANADPSPKLLTAAIAADGVTVMSPALVEANRTANAVMALRLIPQ